MSTRYNYFAPELPELHYLDPDHNATANNVVKRLDECLSRYYETLTNRKYEKPSNSSTLYSFSNKSDSGRHLEGYGSDLVAKICAGIPTSINPDVGGIGVYVSYWIQTGLAMLGFVGTIFWKWTVPNVSVGFLALRYGWTGTRNRNESIRRLSQKHLSRLIAALTDFHKAQCFFMLATNIAALVVIGRGGLDPQSLQQIYNTWIFLKVIALNGFLPITFTLTNLYVVGMSSWYMTLTSCLTVLFSVATFATVGKFNPSASDMEDLKIVAASGGPVECDYRKPGVYCYTPIESLDPYSSNSSWNLDKDADYILAFCLTIMCLLLGHMFKIQNLAVVRSIKCKGPERFLVLARSLWRPVQHLCHHNRAIDLCSKARQVQLKISTDIAPIMALSKEIPAVARFEDRLLIEMTKVRTSWPWQRLQALGWRRSLRILLKAGLLMRPYRVTRTSGMAHALAAGTVDIFKRKYNPEDLERGEEMPPTSNSDQNSLSVPVWKDSPELTSLSANDDDDASEASHKSHDSSLEGPAAIVPLNEEGAGNDDEHRLLPELKLGSRVSTFPRIPYERNASR
ncbi:MAG: hypothetical protein Q9178_007315 [Gyalolechia marmorata]